MVKVSSINIRSICSGPRRAAVLNYLSLVQSDIICVQECNIKEEPSEDAWSHGPAIWSAGSKRNEGVGILFKGWRFKILHSVHIERGRALLVKVEFDGLIFRVLNVYASTKKSERIELFEKLKLFLGGREPLLVLGDFNCILGEGDRRGGGVGGSGNGNGGSGVGGSGGGGSGVGGGVGGVDKSGKILKELCVDLGLEDVGKGKGFTYFCESRKVCSRIDFCFLSRDLKSISFNVHRAPFTDHGRIECIVSMKSDKTHGKGVWKMNIELLEDERVREEYVRMFERWKKRRLDFGSVIEWWEWVKENTKRFFIKKGCERVKGEREEYEWWQKRLTHLEEMRAWGENVSNEIVEAKEKVNKFIESKGKAILAQARAVIKENDEKCTKFFFKKVYGSKSELMSVLDENGCDVSGNDKVKNEVWKFYDNLFSEKIRDMNVEEDVLQQIEMGLEKEDKIGLSEDVKLNELEIGLKEMKRGKTPGLDGLPAEYYKVFWEMIGVYVHEVCIAVLKEGRLPKCMSESLIVLLYKKGEKRDLKNWRPISLLNVDYKLIAKVIANRMRGVIDKMVGEEQVCAVPGRMISESLVCLRDMLWDCKERKQRAAVLTVDFEKAYDRVAHGFMFKVLERMGVPERMIGWVKCLYTDIESKIQVNGWLTEGVKVKSGVRQGCPLSPVLFICVIEPLIRMMMKDKSVRGLMVPGSGGRSLKVIGYMDDVTVICKDVASLRRVRLLIDIFCMGSGFKINMDKSECKFFGEWDVGVQSVWKVCRGSVRVLGVKFESELYGRESWEDVIAKIQRKIQFWSLRTLSMEGKILIIKSVILPILLFLYQVFPAQDRIMRRVVRIVFQFFWSSKAEKLKREKVMKNKMNGGKGMVCVERFLFIRYVGMCVKSCSKENLSGCMTRYTGGSVLRKFGWCEVDLKRPVCFKAPWYYVRIERGIEKFGLDGIEKESWYECKKVSKCLEMKEEMEGIGGLTVVECERVWKNVCMNELDNKEKDLAWMGVHGCLPVRTFQRKRGMSDTEKCPRERCRGIESIVHLFWECSFAKKVWKRFGKMIEGLTGVKTLTYEMVLYGLWKLGKREGRALWILVNCVKECLWDVRNILVFKNERLLVRECTAMVRARLFGYGYMDRIKLGIEEAEKIWHFKSWRIWAVF